MLGNPVAVEKLCFPEKNQKSGDSKCLGDSEKSFIELPGAKEFLRNRSERVFQQPQVGVEKLVPLAGVLIWVIFLWGYRASFFYLRSEPWLILEISILGNERVVSGSRS